jgi:hypothetical protein
MLGEDAHERELERGLLGHLRDFLLELGIGFAFVASQYRPEVGGSDFFYRSALLSPEASLFRGDRSEGESIRARVRGLWKAGRYETCSIDSPEIRGLPKLFLNITCERWPCTFGCRMKSGLSVSSQTGNFLVCSLSGSV